MPSAYLTPAGQPVPQYRPVELTLTSSVSRSNPYAEIELDAEFTSPSGRTVRQGGFWDGGRTWKIRFAPAELGKWRWRTLCTDTKDNGLHGVSGTFDCVKNSGSTDLDRHGEVRISADKRHFEHADGTPFFWLGDTHWMMFDTERMDACNHPVHNGGACPYGGQFQHLAAERKADGFTVYQTYPNFCPNWFTDNRSDMIDPQRFQQVFDPMMEHLASQGFVVALGLGHYTATVHYPEIDICRWARYIGARYGAFPVVWITCQEMNSPAMQGGKESNRQAVWEKAAAELARVNGMDRPHSAHQWVLEPGVRPVWHLQWHNWFALQGGHAGSGLTPQKRYKAYFDCVPARPVLETEAMYECVDCGGIAGTDDVRRSAWRAVLCGSCGYTYGAAGIWALKKSPEDQAWSVYNRKISAWYSGLNLPGAKQMKVLGDFFRSIPWTRLEPRFGDPAFCRWNEPENCVLATAGNELYFAYCHGKTASGELRGLDPDDKYSAEWFDPRTGVIRPVCASFQPEKGRWSVPERPTETDWLLIVKKLK